MGKQRKNKKTSLTIKESVPVVPPLSFHPPFLQFILNKKHQQWIVALFAFALYANSLYNQFALDDGMVLRDNRIVLRGISAIPDILTHDSFYGAIGNTTNLAGGRYRPLSLVSFAIEVSFFGKNPLVHHLINVLLYALTSIVLLSFLSRFIFPRQPLLSFIATLLFVFHPVHTEVVANIKSRDEIFSLLFLLLTLHHLLIYCWEKNTGRHLFLSILFYLLALFSKENGLIFAVLIPLTIFFFTQKKLSQIITLSLPFMAVIAFYFLVRISLLGIRNGEIREVMDNPYVLATASQKFATVLFVFLRYLELLFFPYPLTYDYSYRQVPYSGFSDPMVVLSIVIYSFSGIYSIIGLRKKDILSWCILFFFGTIFIVSNVLFNIGAPMAERFLYQASLPFLIALVECVRRIVIRFKLTEHIVKPAVIISLLLVFTTASYEIVKRNADWKTDDILFIHDVKISSNSARANTYAGVALVHRADEVKDTVDKNVLLNEALRYFRKSLEIKADYLPTFLNMGVAYSRLDSVETAEDVWNKARAIAPQDPKLKQYDEYLFRFYYVRGLKEGSDKNYLAAVIDLEKSVKFNPNSADAWHNLGGAYYTVKNFQKAKQAWEKALQLDPQKKETREGLNALRTIMNEPIVSAHQ